MLKNFPKSHELHKLINKNNNKISYSCTPNMSMIIAGHNKKLLKKYHEDSSREINVPRTCNCRAPRSCPLDGNCLQKDILYNGKCTADNEPSKNYIGLTATTFKERFGTHKQSFNHRKHSHSTTLSSHFWNLKDSGKNPSVKFSIIRHVKSYSPETGKCPLCTQEKLLILKTDPATITNTRSELMSHCLHKRRFLLQNYENG